MPSRMRHASSYPQPYVRILEQPLERGFRFRYKSEAGAHGGLPAESSQRNSKKYPTIKIENYMGPARLEVTLMTNEPEPRLHVHKLVGKNCEDGVCHVRLHLDSDMVYSFQNLGVLHVPKKEVTQILQERLDEEYRIQRMMNNDADSDNYDLTDMEKQMLRQNAEESAKTMELNVVRLCFQAYIIDSAGNEVPIPPVLSSPVYDSKSPNTAALKICRMDKQAGLCVGNEEIFLLCERVQKDDVSIRFFELDEAGKEVWHDYGKFSIHDVHKQYAIVFRTPAFRHQNITKPAKVFIQLQKKKDGLTSEPKPFTFKPLPCYEEVGRKRQKNLLTVTDVEILNDGFNPMSNKSPVLDTTSLSSFPHRTKDSCAADEFVPNAASTRSTDFECRDLGTAAHSMNHLPYAYMTPKKMVNIGGQYAASLATYGQGEGINITDHIPASRRDVVDMPQKARPYVCNIEPSTGCRRGKIIVTADLEHTSGGGEPIQDLNHSHNATNRDESHNSNININYHHYQQQYFYPPSIMTQHPAQGACYSPNHELIVQGQSKDRSIQDSTGITYHSRGRSSVIGSVNDFSSIRGAMPYQKHAINGGPGSYEKEGRDDRWRTQNGRNGEENVEPSAINHDQAVLRYVCKREDRNLKDRANFLFGISPHKLDANVGNEPSSLRKNSDPYSRISGQPVQQLIARPVVASEVSPTASDKHGADHESARATNSYYAGSARSGGSSVRCNSYISDGSSPHSMGSPTNVAYGNGGEPIEKYDGILLADGRRDRKTSDQDLGNGYRLYGTYRPEDQFVQHRSDSSRVRHMDRIRLTEDPTPYYHDQRWRREDGHDLDPSYNVGGNGIDEMSSLYPDERGVRDIALHDGASNVCRNAPMLIEHISNNVPSPPSYYGQDGYAIQGSSLSNGDYAKDKTGSQDIVPFSISQYDQPMDDSNQHSQEYVPMLIARGHDSNKPINGKRDGKIVGKVYPYSANNWAPVKKSTTSLETIDETLKTLKINGSKEGSITPTSIPRNILCEKTVIDRQPNCFATNNNCDEDGTSGQRTSDQSSKILIRGSQILLALNEYAALADPLPLLTLFNRYICIPDEDGNTPLHHALISKNEPIAILLLQSMIQNGRTSQSALDCHNNEQKTPLHLAIENRLQKCSKLLLSLGTDVSIVDGKGNNPIHLCLIYSLDEVLKYLTTRIYSRTKLVLNDMNYSGLSAIHIAASRPSNRYLRLLNLTDIDVNIKEGKSGRAPLHISIQKGLIENALYLIEKMNADVNAITYNGERPLDLIKEDLKSYPLLYDILVGKGAEVQKDKRNSDIESDDSDTIDCDCK